MRYPYERFLRYLVSRKADVPRALERIGLPSVGDIWRPDALGKLSASAPRQIATYLQAPDREQRPVPRAGFLDWATQQEIDLWWREQPEFGGEPDPALALAGRLFFSPATRAVAGMLLLAKIGRSELRALVRERFGVEVDDAALTIYERGYWDTRATTSAFWTDVVQALDPEERHLYGIGLQTPSPKLNELRQIVGLVPHDEDPEAVLQETMTFALQGMREAMRMPVPEHQNVFKWMAAAQQAAVQVRKGLQLTRLKESEAAPDPAKAFNLFSVTVERLAIPTLAELQGELPEPPGGGRT